jgi:hypothetical protein
MEKLERATSLAGSSGSVYRPRIGLAYRFQDLETVAIGKMDVEEDDVRALLLDERDRGLAVGRLERGIWSPPTPLQAGTLPIASSPQVVLK